MSQSYIDFSFQVSIASTAAYETAKKVEMFIHSGLKELVDCQEDIMVENINLAINDTFPEWDDETKLCFFGHVSDMAEGILDVEESTNFGVELSKDSLWLYSPDSGGNFEGAVFYAQMYMQLGLTDETHKLATAAFYCSKPVLDSAGGSTCVITKDQVYWNDVDKWSRSIVDGVAGKAITLSDLMVCIENRGLGKIEWLIEDKDSGCYLIGTLNALVFWSPKYFDFYSRSQKPDTVFEYGWYFETKNHSLTFSYGDAVLLQDNDHYRSDSEIVRLMWESGKFTLVHRI